MHLIEWKAALQEGLEKILEYWLRHAVDHENGGFHGRLDENNLVVSGAPRGAVLTARICWTFSAAYRLTGRNDLLEMAGYAFDCLDHSFLDPVYGGAYRTIDQYGLPLDKKKQLYNQAFVLYAYAEFYRASGRQQVLDKAIAQYQLIRRQGWDPLHGGYLEAFSRNWRELDDQRLSRKDLNGAKTMNTHLHLLEAFSNLYRAWPDTSLAEGIRILLHLFESRFIDAETGHLRLYFDKDWSYLPGPVSYGHDIEAAWLLTEAADLLGDETLRLQIHRLSMFLTHAALEGVDTDGGLWEEYDPLRQSLRYEKHWWPQAEAMVGFFNAWQLTGLDAYLHQAGRSWSFINRFLVDHEKGEWFWGVDANGNPLPGQDKIGIWKCPYHNSRACMELIRRIRE